MDRRLRAWACAVWTPEALGDSTSPGEFVEFPRPCERGVGRRHFGVDSTMRPMSGERITFSPLSVWMGGIIASCPTLHPLFPRRGRGYTLGDDLLTDRGLCIGHAPPPAPPGLAARGVSALPSSALPPLWPPLLMSSSQLT